MLSINLGEVTGHAILPTLLEGGRGRGQGMTKFGYHIHTVRAHVPRHKDRPLVLDRLVPGGDLMYGLHHKLEKLRQQSDLVKDDRYESAFDVREVKPQGRTLWLLADAGSYGLHGNTTNIDTRSRTPFTDRDATMTDKRAMFVIPQESEVGFLFCERRSSSHLKEHLEKTVLAACRRQYGCTINISAYVDYEAWDAFLQRGTGLEVKSVWRPRTMEQRVERSDLQDEGELVMAVRGSLAERATRSVRDSLRRLAGGPEPEGIEIATPANLLPLDAEDYERQRLMFKIDDAGNRGTIVIERAELPQFVYPLQGRLDDPLLRSTWVAEVERLSTSLDLPVVPGWDRGAWTSEQLLRGAPEQP